MGRYPESISGPASHRQPEDFRVIIHCALQYPRPQSFRRPERRGFPPSCRARRPSGVRASVRLLLQATVTRTSAPRSADRSRTPAWVAPADSRHCRPSLRTAAGHAPGHDAPPDLRLGLSWTRNTIEDAFRRLRRREGSMWRGRYEFQALHARSGRRALRGGICHRQCTTFGVTWNGGIAFTRNDCAPAEKVVDTFKASGGLAKPPPEWDPVATHRHLELPVEW